MNGIQVIGICGPIGSGKSTIAKALVKEYREVEGRFAVISPMGEKVKEVAHFAFGWDGNKDDKGRKLLNNVGTTCGRAYNPDIWVGAVREKVASYAQSTVGTVVVVDDVRFDNEAKMIHDFGGILFCVTGRAAKETYSDLASENGLSKASIDDEVCNGKEDSGVLAAKYIISKLK